MEDLKFYFSKSPGMALPIVTLPFNTQFLIKVYNLKRNYLYNKNQRLNKRKKTK